jgi:hypothetical protein
VNRRRNVVKLGLRLGEDLLRLSLLALAVLVEGAAVLSVVLQTAFLPLGGLYPSVVSAAIFLLPSVIGFLSRRFEAAIVLAVLPFWTLTLVYGIAYAPVYNVDLYLLGTLAGRVAGSSFLLGGLGLFGWLVRRAILGAKATQPRIRPADM